MLANPKSDSCLLERHYNRFCFRDCSLSHILWPSANFLFKVDSSWLSVYSITACRCTVCLCNVSLHLTNITIIICILIMGLWICSHATVSSQHYKYKVKMWWVLFQISVCFNDLVCSSFVCWSLYTVCMFVYSSEVILDCCTAVWIFIIKLSRKCCESASGRLLQLVNGKDLIQ